MIDKLQKLEVSAEELAVIEAALHTQSKILNVQASAGDNTGARAQLGKVKSALARVTQLRPAKSDSDPRSCKLGWFGKPSIFS
ncbi:MAG: hypothetical protein AAF943_03830 [Pseudomonadota bacterium]